MNLTIEDVRRVIREEMGLSGSPDPIEFGDRVRADGYGTGIVVDGPDSDGDYRVYFGMGDWSFLKIDQIRKVG